MPANTIEQIMILSLDDSSQWFTTDQIKILRTKGGMMMCGNLKKKFCEIMKATITNMVVSGFSWPVKKRIIKFMILTSKIL